MVTKIFIRYIYFLKHLCGGLSDGFYAHCYFLKIIVIMKRWYVGVLGYVEKCINFAGVLFKRFFLKSAWGNNSTRFV